MPENKFFIKLSAFDLAQVLHVVCSIYYTCLLYLFIISFKLTFKVTCFCRDTWSANGNCQVLVTCSKFYVLRGIVYLLLGNFKISCSAKNNISINNPWSQGIQHKTNNATNRVYTARAGKVYFVLC